MRKIILLAVVLIAGYYGYNSFSGSKVAALFEPQITISDLQSNPSVFADSLVELQSVTVENTESVLNYSKSIICDGSGQKILLLSNKPYKKGQTINVRGTFLRLYQKDEKSCEAFITEDLRPLNDLLKVLLMSWKGV